jgi:hypothetical protein
MYGNETYIKAIQMLMANRGLDIAKADMTSTLMSNAAVIALDWQLIWDIYGEKQTPILERIGRSKAMAVEHRWRSAKARAAAANTSNEGSASKTAVSVIPGANTNTCQIIKGAVTVSGSAMQEAENGIYGDGLGDLAGQIDLETKGLLKDMEYALLFGVESTTDPRQMKGLVGAPGTYASVFQTTKTNAASSSATAMTDAILNTHFNTILEQQAGIYPDTLICSYKMQKLISTFASAYRLVVDKPEGLLALPSGGLVTDIVAPWGELVHIVPHPMCANSATPANNWILTCNLDQIKWADFRPMFNKPVTAADVDGEKWEIITEGCVETHVEPHGGIIYGFNQPT